MKQEIERPSESAFSSGHCKRYILKKSYIFSIAIIADVVENWKKKEIYASHKLKKKVLGVGKV